MKPRGKFSKAEIDRIRDRTMISDVIGRYVTWDAKKSAPSRGDYWACCPFHGEKRPSFHCEDRKGRYHCFGCGVSGDHYKFLTEKTGCTFAEAVEMLGGEREIREETPAEKQRRERENARRQEERMREKESSETALRRRARAIWLETVTLEGTLGHHYFIKRGIGFAAQFQSLRFHGSLEYFHDGKVIGKFPAVVAGLQAPDDGRFLAIWRIYINDAAEKNSEVPNAKLGLGAYTEYGGSVWLGDPRGQFINTCEGIETGLGIYGITGGVVCPALNTSGLENFIPPAGSRNGLIWPDGDVDRFRQIDGKDKHFESPGLKAAKVLRARQLERDPSFKFGIQPTPKTGRDYLDIWNKMKGKSK